jgi:hypothetical protein
MLTVRTQAIDGTGTFTLSDSQPCRLLTLLHRHYPGPPVVPIAKIKTLQLVRRESCRELSGLRHCHPSQRPRLGRVLTNRPDVSAFGQSRHWSRHRQMTESDPELTLRAANYCIAKGSCAFVLAALRKLS